jgi:PRC-barrel domain protein
MRASDLIGRPVVDGAGTRIGLVRDLLCVQDGPPRGQMATFRVDTLVVSPRATGAYLGYHRRQQRGPWLVRVLIERLHRHARLVPWTAVTHHDGQIVLGVDAATLARPDDQQR